MLICLGVNAVHHRPGVNTVHHRVEDNSYFPTVQLSDTVTARKLNQVDSVKTGVQTPATTPPPPALLPATLIVYDQNFDDMDDVSKAETIVVLLDTLPSIHELRTYLLEKSRVSEPSLRTWKERVSPAALGLLRWIIASNRSCIVQVDKIPGQDDADNAGIRTDQKCSNVADGWVQFRFAQGSPDKEQRFLNALKTQQANLNAKYPTMFAFHGSPLPNWHSIIRHGLDFRETLHGRAYGHGVYHAMDQNVSMSYASAGGGVSFQVFFDALKLTIIQDFVARFRTKDKYSHECQRNRELPITICKFPTIYRSSACRLDSM
jgi:ubiquitin-conjugating enzyme E2 Q